MKRITRICLAGICLLIAAPFAGCGYKTLPVPPQEIVPNAVNDLRYTIDEKGVNLTWSYPVKTKKGSDIVDISRFDLYRAVVSLDDYCSTCPIPFAEPIQIPGGVLGKDGTRKASYKSALLRSGHKYFFKVQSRTSFWAASDDSNIISFVWHTPAKAADGLEATPGDGSISLKWQPVTSMMDGTTIAFPVQYQLMRSRGGKDFQNLGTPQKKTEFVDVTVKNGQKYFYRVQSVLIFKENQVQGGMSQSIAVTGVDQTPPPPVSGVTAVQSAKGIKIFWDASGAKDLKAYRIYRRLATEEKATMIAEIEGRFLLYEDVDVPADARSYYSVTAIDATTPPNESLQSQEAIIRH